ncbi:hypothetical protein PCANC_20549 [Puccinia coronata f. sp. avenae]|uniref:Mitochondrial carrier protein n=1 Tax=Puccinia coronata f. sp. avenae TaxID=200324 RepID=A0A2N5U5L6_9BASI|nr:hypothetical protein PCANC_20549 [Puccinia coronata f. sp. avenae]
MAPAQLPLQTPVRCVQAPDGPVTSGLQRRVAELALQIWEDFQRPHPQTLRSWLYTAGRVRRHNCGLGALMRPRKAKPSPQGSYGQRSPRRVTESLERITIRSARSGCIRGTADKRTTTRLEPTTCASGPVLLRPGDGGKGDGCGDFPSNGGGRRVAANRPHRPCSVAPTIMVTVLPACLGRQGRHVVTSRPHAVSMTEPSQVRRLSSEIVPLCKPYLERLRFGPEPEGARVRHISESPSLEAMQSPLQQNAVHSRAPQGFEYLVEGAPIFQREPTVGASIISREQHGRPERNTNPGRKHYKMEAQQQPRTRRSRGDDDDDSCSSMPSTAAAAAERHLKSGVAGGIAGCVAKTLVSPLDRVKILFQTGHPEYVRYSGSLAGVFRAIGAIWAQAGIRGLVQGHSATLFRIFPYAGIKFMSYDILHKALMPETEGETAAGRFAAGALSGVMAVVVTYPLEIVRVRTAIEVRRAGADPVRVRDVARVLYYELPASPSSRWDTHFFLRFPPAKFYRGFAPTICGMVPYAGTSFLVWGTLQSKLPTHLPGTMRDNVVVNLLCGSVAGMAAQTVSYPLEIIRRKMQVGGPLAHCTIAQTASQIFASHGPRGFFVGLSIGYLKVIPMTAISFVTWSKLKLRFE